MFLNLKNCYLKDLQSKGEWDLKDFKVKELLLERFLKWNNCYLKDFKVIESETWKVYKVRIVTWKISKVK